MISKVLEEHKYQNFPSCLSYSKAPIEFLYRGISNGISCTNVASGVTNTELITLQSGDLYIKK